jgi:phenylacetate-CoA ligase
VIPYATMIERLRDFGFDAPAAVRAPFGGGAPKDKPGDRTRGVRALPFVYVFGRSHFAVSYYGANVFPEMVAVGLEQPETREWVTGKFVMEVKEDEGRDPHLFVAVELAPGREAPPSLGDAVADAVLRALMRLNSEFANYVSPERRRPRVTLWPAGHPEYFPVGVKHRYSRK